MRFPLASTAKVASHIIRHKLKGTPRFATVLQLEPLHTCNLTCTGCGRIREYSTSLKNVMTLEDCLQAPIDCGAPMVSICGGEPLIYPQIEALTEGILGQGRIVYMCTNAMFMRRKMRAWLAKEFLSKPAQVEKWLGELLAQELVTAKDAEAVRQGPKDPAAPVIAPNQFFYWNVHLDGLEYTHDLIVEREGVFKECVLAMRMAKLLGYQVATNTTIYKETDMAEIEAMYEFLGEIGLDGHTISPGYDYDAAKKDMVERLGLQPENFFLTRDMTREKFKDSLDWAARFPFLNTPVFLEFLAGQRELTCSAWAVPTRNIGGWKGPCYFMTDDHFASYGELLEKVDWSKYGVVQGKARDPRCENCMVHCGYEPSATLGGKENAQRGDLWKNIRFNFGPKPKPSGKGKAVNAFNGVTAGRGHLTGEQVKKPAPRPVAAAA